jgi:hypothetical protein
MSQQLMTEQQHRSYEILPILCNFKRGSTAGGRELVCLQRFPYIATTTCIFE